MAVNLETLQIQFEIRDNTGSKLKKLGKQLSRMKGPEIDADTKKAKKKMEDLQKTAEDTNIKTAVDADTKKAEKKLDELAKETKKSGTITVGADTNGALNKIAAAAEAADNASGEVKIGGDDQPFQDELKLVKDAADGTDAGDADIGGDKTDFDTVKDGLKDAADGIDAGDADIGGDRTRFDTVKGGLKNAADGIDAGDAHIGGDKTEFDETKDQVEDAAQSLKGGKVKIDADTDSAMSGMRKVYNAMKALGLAKFGKEIFEFGMSSVNEAYAGQAVENQIANIGGTEAMDRIYAFTEEMNRLYGLNETGLAEMAKNFTAVFKGTGMDLDSALDYGIEMTKYAIDYASALDKTPGEIADIFMSAMNGQTEVARNAGIYGLTADALSDQIDQMNGITDLEKELADIQEKRAIEEAALSRGNPNSEQANKEKERIKTYQQQEEALKAQIEQQRKLQEETAGMDKPLAFFEIMKENAETMGFTGDWARTFEEYGNQTTVLGEQWKTLKEDIGEFLTPAATEATKALNDLMFALSGAVESLGKSTFASDVNGYFGTMEVDEVTMNQAISHVTEPLSKMTTAVDEANEKLKTANDNLATSYKSFLALLLSAGTDQDLSDNADEIEASSKEMAENAIETVEMGRESMIERLNTFTGGLLDAETSAMVGIVDSYFDQAILLVNSKKKEFYEALSKVQQEYTPENLQDLKDAAYAMTEEAYTLSAGYMGADEYDWLKSTYKSGQLSAESIEAWMNGMNEAAAAEQKKITEELEKSRRDFIAMGQQVINPATGSYYTASQLDKMFSEETSAFMAQQQNEAQGRRLGYLSEMLLGEYGGATADVYNRLYSGEITADQAMEQLTTMVRQLEESGFIQQLLEFGNKTPAMQQMLDLWTGIGQFARVSGVDVKGGGLYHYLTAEGYDLMAQGGVYDYAREAFRGTKDYEKVMRDAGLFQLYSTLDTIGFSNHPYYKPQMPEAPSAGSEEFWSEMSALFPNISGLAFDPFSEGYGPISQEISDMLRGSGEMADDLSGVAGEFRDALSALPTRINLSLNIGTYELGAAVTEAMNIYNASTGP